MKVLITISFYLLFVTVEVLAQSDSSRIQQYFYPDGRISSEGALVNGKPEGYWKTYWENGKLKSEGNRKNFELDSLWKFYDEKGRLILDINYKSGKKNGLKHTYREAEMQAENYVNDVKQGISSVYYPDGKLQRTIPFVNGLENGLGKEYDTNGMITTLIDYKRGFILSKENVNRRDKNGLKQGTWKVFWENGNIRSEGNYRADKRNGYFKEYMSDGKLFKIFKYENDSLIPDAEEVARIDERADYYNNGRIKVKAQFKNNLQDGIRREYTEEGKLERGFVYKRGIMIAEGITDEAGLRQGAWKDYYDDGQIRAEGKYKEGNRVGLWKFYHHNGKIEEVGNYDARGRLDGDWKWYYESGQIRREESFSGGKPDGPYSEYDEEGNVVAQGEYLDGLEQGKWLYQYGDHKEEGSFANGLRDGWWKYYYDNGQLAFEGRFVEDLPDGRHTYYWDNGNKKDEGFYVMGVKEGDWYKFEADGSLFLIITYKNGIEKKYDGSRILPELDEE